VAAAELWLAVVALASLVMLHAALGQLPVILGAAPVAILTPLALLRLAWLSLDKTPSRRSVVAILALPFITGSAGLLLGISINRARSRALERQWEATRSQYAPAPVTRYCWARIPTRLSSSPDFCGDSVSIERFQVRGLSPRWRGDDRLILVTGVLRNNSGSPVRLSSIWGEYLSRTGQPVGDFRCEPRYPPDCGLSRLQLQPGYIADIADTLVLGPSLSRRDTVSFYIRYSVIP